MRCPQTPAQLIVEPGAGPHVEDICLGVTGVVPCNALGGSGAGVARGNAGGLLGDPWEGDMRNVTHCASADGMGQNLCKDVSGQANDLDGHVE